MIAILIIPGVVYRRNYVNCGIGGIRKEQLSKPKKDSSNSGKPPSSDLVKPQKTNSKDKPGKKGGQVGHKKHERQPFAPGEIDFRQDYHLEKCPHCNGNMEIDLSIAPVSAKIN